MSELTLTKDIRTLKDGGQLIARAGTVVDFITEQDELVIVQLKNGSISFPLRSGEYEAEDAIYHGQDMNPDALWMSRESTVKHGHK